MRCCIYMFSMDSADRSRIMSRIRSRDTGPEMALRRELWRMGLRYRVQYGRERIDIAFTGKKVAVFVDGCFWHSCPIHFHYPKSNIAYWKPKLERNIERAKEKDARLGAEGWAVLHFWEHEVDADAASCAQRIASAISQPEKEGGG